MQERENQQNCQPHQSQSGSGQQQASQQQGGQQQGLAQQNQAEFGRAAQTGGVSGESNMAQTGGQQGVSGLGDSDASRASGQQGGANAGSGQQHQFDSQGSGQQGGANAGSGQQSGFAGQIQEHQEVVDDRGQHIGTVDHVEGDRIKLSRRDSGDGQHHYVSMSQVAGIEGGKVRLRERGDNDFGQQAG